jgi:hypothetical protein
MMAMPDPHDAEASEIAQRIFVALCLLVAAGLALLIWS